MTLELQQLLGCPHGVEAGEEHQAIALLVGRPEARLQNRAGDRVLE